MKTSFSDVKPIDARKKKHTWLKKISLAFYYESAGPLVEEVIQRLQKQFERMGHTRLARPEGSPDLLITTASVDEPVDWHTALLFTARRRFQLDHSPTVFTIVHLTRERFQSIIGKLEAASTKLEPDPADYDFPGLAPSAYLTLHEQGQRAGPILAMARLLQALTKSIRIVLVIGETRPDEAYVFDLAGGYPRVDATDPAAFYQDIVLRMVTAVSTQEVTSHQVVGEPVSWELWKSLDTPEAMRRAGKELGDRHFFSSMIEVAKLVAIPRLGDTLSQQYSEGCYATWDTKIDALIATITGSARPVRKDHLTDDEMAVITGIRPDGMGALVRLVDGKLNDPPSSEAVEMVGMDSQLPWINLGPGWGVAHNAPIVRSKLHGHRGVRSYDPSLIEHVYLDEAYYHYPVSCSTDAQADAVMTVFAKSEALTRLDDPRLLVFTILPGHGLVIVEKWVKGKAPFQLIWEAIDSGALAIDSRVPQGTFRYLADPRGRMALEDDSNPA